MGRSEFDYTTDSILPAERFRHRASFERPGTSVAIVLHIGFDREFARDRIADFFFNTEFLVPIDGRLGAGLHQEGCGKPEHEGSSRKQAARKGIRGDSAAVCVTVDLAGFYDGAAFFGRFAYSRVWYREAGRWRVVLAHCSERPAAG